MKQSILFAPKFKPDWPENDPRLMKPHQAEEVARTLAEHPVLFIDYETNLKHSVVATDEDDGATQHSAPFMLGYISKDMGARVVDFRMGPGLREAVRDGLTARKGLRTIAFNIAFEQKVQRSEGGKADWLPWDPMHAAFATNEIREEWNGFGAFSQKALAFRELGKQPAFAIAVREWFKAHTGGEPRYDLLPASLCLAYNYEDLELGFELHEKLMKQIMANGQLELVQTDSYVTDIVERMRARGIKFDDERAGSLIDAYSAQFKQTVNTIYDALGRSNFDFNSHQKVFGLLYGEWKLPMHPDVEKAGKVDDSVLKWMLTLPEVKNDPRKTTVIRGIDTARELFKMNDTYLRPWKYEWQREGYIHGRVNMRGARTRRFSADSPNMQNVPARTDLGANLRSVFISRPGFTTYSMDESQAEYRMFASYSGNLRLCQGYRDNPDFDIHVEVAELMGLIAKLGPDKGRKFAKNVNFGTLYNMGVDKLARTLGISKSEAQAILDAYYRAISGIRELRKRLQEDVKTHGYVKDPFGGRRHLGDNEAYKALNTICQMSVADLIRRAMRKADPIISAFGGYMLLQVHDELIFELPGEPEDHREVLLDIRNNAMQDFDEFGFKVPFRSDCERWAPNWQNVEAVTL